MHNILCMQICFILLLLFFLHNSYLSLSLSLLLSHLSFYSLLSLFFLVHFLFHLFISIYLSLYISIYLSFSLSHPQYFLSSILPSSSPSTIIIITIIIIIIIICPHSLPGAGCNDPVPVSIRHSPHPPPPAHQPPHCHRAAAGGWLPLCQLSPHHQLGRSSVLSRQQEGEEEYWDFV